VLSTLSPPPLSPPLPPPHSNTNSTIRDWVLSAYDVRGAVLEVASRWVGLVHIGSLPVYEQQLVALEAVQIYAPLAHALGLGAVAAEMEDAAFRVLFPQSYASTGAWMRSLSLRAHELLHTARSTLADALESDPEFATLAAGCELRVRTKSQYSVMRKLLRLDNLAAGGRRRDELWDLLGLRAIVEPRADLPPAQAEAAASAACYRVQELAHMLWGALPGRSKDYIAAPKSNGYQSLHSTLWLCGDGGSGEWGSEAGSSTSSSTTLSSWDDEEEGQQQQQASSSSTGLDAAAVSTTGQIGGLWAAAAADRLPTASAAVAAAPSAAAAPIVAASGAGERVLCTLELQVRTAAMHAAAERGDAAHAGYKGGLDRRQVRKLRSWTAALQRRLSGQRQLQLPASRTSVPAGLLPAAGQTGGAAATGPPSSSSDQTASTAAAALASTTDAAAAGALFAHLDLDGDGALSLAELTALLSELEGPTAAAVSAAELMRALDADGDKSVSQEEFMRFWLQHNPAGAAVAADAGSGTSTRPAAAAAKRPSPARRGPSAASRPRRPPPNHVKRLISRAIGTTTTTSSTAAAHASGTQTVASISSGSGSSSSSSSRSRMRISSAPSSRVQSRSTGGLAAAGNNPWPPAAALHSRTRPARSVACSATAGRSNGSSSDGEQPRERLWLAQENQERQQQWQPSSSSSSSAAGSSSGISAAASPWQQWQPPRPPQRPQRADDPQEGEGDPQQQQQQQDEQSSWERLTRSSVGGAAVAAWNAAPEPQPDMELMVSGAPCEHRATQRPAVSR